jgi:hypothetical protein
MKLAVPEFKRNLIEPLSDDASLSVADLFKSTLFNFDVSAWHVMGTYVPF